jgi:hypothetical protein
VTRRAAVLAVSLLALALPAPAPAAPEAYPVSEVRPGLRGELLTVLEGESPDTLAVEVVGVLDRMEPESHIILVRGLDERFARIGIAAGMSGSPIYIGDRLLGAMAFAFVGATEAIGGATPFEEMQGTLSGAFPGAGSSSGRLDADPARPPGAAPRADAELPPFPEWRAQWAARADRWPSARTPAAGEGLPSGMRPIEMPVALGGPLGDAAGASGAWQSLGLARGPGAADATVGEGGGARSSSGVALRPGDAFGIALITGDMVATAIGTVTWIDRDRMLGLGHPMFQLSPFEVPITRARIHTVVPTNAVSFKVGTALEEIGALVADRKPGVAAVLGRRAPRIPLDLVVRVGGRERRYHFDVVRSDILTPQMMSAAVEAALTRHEFALGPATLASHLRIRLGDGRELERRDLFQTIGPGQTAAADAMAPVAYLAATSLAPFDVADVELELDLVPEIRATSVDAVEVERRGFRAGEAVPVTVRLQRHLGGPETRQVTLRLPSSLAPGKVLLAAGSAGAFYAWDQERAPQKYAPRTFEDLLRLLREYPSDESLIVRVYGASRGVVHQGRELSSLPLSKWRALSQPESGGRTVAVAGKILDETTVPMGQVVLGGVMVELEIVR